MRQKVILDEQCFFCIDILHLVMKMKTQIVRNVTILSNKHACTLMNFQT